LITSLYKRIQVDCLFLVVYLVFFDAFFKMSEIICFTRLSHNQHLFHDSDLVEDHNQIENAGNIQLTSTDNQVYDIVQLRTLNNCNELLVENDKCECVVQLENGQCFLFLTDSSQAIQLPDSITRVFQIVEYFEWGPGCTKVGKRLVQVEWYKQRAHFSLVHTKDDTQAT